MLLQTVVLFLAITLSSSYDTGFNYSSFHGANLNLTGVSEVIPSGALQLTNNSQPVIGHAFYPNLLQFKNSSKGNAFSFSTAFVFAITRPIVSPGSGFAFVISPSTQFEGANSTQYLGLFNLTGNGDPENQVFAVEFDTTQNIDVGDIDGNHVGIDLNSVRSNVSASAAYYLTEDHKITKHNLSLKSEDPIQVWIEYDGTEKLLNITLSPIRIPGRTGPPLISSRVDLSPILQKYMYVGFSASTGIVASYQYILGWSFMINGRAQNLDSSDLPWYPRSKSIKGLSMVSKIGISLSSIILAIAAISVILYLVWKRTDGEIAEDWELANGPHRFSYKEIFMATKGFHEEELIGFGGFGKVYKGVMRDSGLQVAVKQVAHESEERVREFVAEISSIGKLQHRNLVRLIGWCKQKTKLIIIYEYMPHGSLDKYLFHEDGPPLSWKQRHKILKGVASALLYLHEQWEQVVIHRDVKASNVLLDAEMNARLGDFGLARLYEHGSNSQTTRVVGTIGYLAPEMSLTGKATTETDVFAYGAVLLEVASGRRPISPQRLQKQVILVDWVWECFKNGKLLDVADPRLEGCFEIEEMTMVLWLGLWCSHPVPDARPSMRQVYQYLNRDVPFPEISATKLAAPGMENFHYLAPHASSHTELSICSAGTEILLSGGR
ncbi:L-type lectin-domain containing receptor kinase IV.2 [Amborella trichopoda]|uniref:non-specific serine/threonine protein kinase n=1 Tax=Amborella trichopoda TaxID=13333 RepID=W1PJ13_AMBTC|nr:L-type lectin-domain containing receptor kinase IV.2 [Amborella trichopoda]ERN07993.1 hypothetical protein AMTR_s00012p00254790 [Amborella trichopoda]|eukprot:XP_006846318.1 L-type lectin-domain containing receptor kinase IV.2 [Amborella trichopoda]